MPNNRSTADIVFWTIVFTSFVVYNFANYQYNKQRLATWEKAVSLGYAEKIITSEGEAYVWKPKTDQ